MIKCQVCGMECRNDAKSCLNCGADLNPPPTPAEEDKGITEERTVMLDPESMQRKIQEELAKEGRFASSEQASPQAFPPPPPPPARRASSSQPPPPSPGASGPPPPPPPSGAQGYGGQGYGGQGHGGQGPMLMPMMPQQNPLAVTALIFGIVADISLVLALCCGLIPVLLGIPAIVLGLMARKQIEESSGTQTGEGMAKAGIICGIAAVALGVLIYGGFLLLAVISEATNSGGGGF